MEAVADCRKCTQCGEEAEELSQVQRVCTRCHRRVAEARARPFTETNVQRKASLLNKINANFDLEYLARMANAKEHDDRSREHRQRKIRERRYKHEMGKFNDKLPRKPVISLDKVIQLKKDILNIFNCNGCTGATFKSRLVITSRDISKLTGVARELLYKTLSVHSSEYVTGKEVETLATKIAGNYTTLRKNIPLMEQISGVPVEEWALLKIIGINNNFIDSKGVPGFNMYTEILSGKLAGETLVSGYAMPVCRIFGKKLGVRREDLKYLTPKHFTQFIGWGYLVPGRDSSTRPRSMDTTLAQKEHNRELTQARLSTTTCPKGHKPRRYVSCLECPAGYGSKTNIFRSCRYAVRRDALRESEQGEKK